jgi:hypothetical protein
MTRRYKSLFDLFDYFLSRLDGPFKETGGEGGGGWGLGLGLAGFKNLESKVATRKKILKILSEE